MVKEVAREVGFRTLSQLEQLIDKKFKVGENGRFKSNKTN